MKTVAVSGYFTILHKGHIELFEKAKELGDKLIVIVNNNEQQKNKKGALIHDANDIKYIIERLHFVDSVVLSIDNDATVCKTLEMIKPDIFANGGDRFDYNVPEFHTCKKLRIQTVFNLGEKVNSSTNILNKEKGF